MNLAQLAQVGIGLQVGSKLAGGGIAMSEGRRAGEVADYRAGAMDQQATAERATAQRRRFETERETAKVQSTQRAVAAASGGGATSPTILDLMGDTAKRGAYLADLDTFAGEERAKGLETQAKITRMEGEAARKRGRNAFFGSILDAGATGLTGYGRLRRYEAGERDYF